MPQFVEEYRTVDKSGWGDGPWQSEPDKAVWVDEATGLDCMVVRSEVTGSLCGYVGVPEGHPAFDKDYNDVDVSVHGGLTFAGRCYPLDDHSRGICHIPQPGRSDVIHWLGFDTAHAWDIMPAMEARERAMGWEVDSPFHTAYWTFAAVVGEIQGLAEQLRGYVVTEGWNDSPPMGHQAPEADPEKRRRIVESIEDGFWDMPIVAAYVNIIGRTGAREFQLRFDDEPEPVVWIAVAEYGGAYEAAGAIVPFLAIRRLAEQLIDGGRCTHCDRFTGITEDIDAMLMDDAFCWFQYDPELATFRRSCEGD